MNLQIAKRVSGLVFLMTLSLMTSGIAQAQYIEADDLTGFGDMMGAPGADSSGDSWGDYSGDFSGGGLSSDGGGFSDSGAQPIPVEIIGHRTSDTGNSGIVATIEELTEQFQKDLYLWEKKSNTFLVNTRQMIEKAAKLTSAAKMQAAIVLANPRSSLAEIRVVEFMVGQAILAQSEALVAIQNELEKPWLWEYERNEIRGLRAAPEMRLSELNGLAIQLRNFEVGK